MLLMTALSAYGILIIANRYICVEITTIKNKKIIPSILINGYTNIAIIGIFILAGIIGNVIITSRFVEKYMAWPYILIALVMSLIIFEAIYYHYLYSTISKSSKRVKFILVNHLFFLGISLGYFIVTLNFNIIFIWFLFMLIEPTLMIIERYSANKKKQQR